MFKSLQACRGVAALLVVLFHLGGALAADKYFGVRSFGKVFQFGDAGVEFFFVLSGFIITWVHFEDLGRPERLLSYLRKRALRIYPVFWIVWLGVFCLALASPSTRGTVPHDPLIVLKSLALLPQDPAVAGATGAPVLIVAWSLHYEVLFYAVVAAFIWNRSAGFWICALLLFNVGSCHFQLCSFPRAFFSDNLLFAFALGVLVALTCKSTMRIERPLALAILGGVAFCATGGIEVIQDSREYVLDRRLMFGVFSAAIVLGLVRAEDGGRLPTSHRWLSCLGDASFALYLIHFPLISALCKAMVALGLHGLTGAIVSFPLILACCIAVSLAFHERIEKPLLRLLAGRGVGLFPTSIPAG
jgi:peptidoglycan/LPS O-acetylase OafA/YrhL